MISRELAQKCLAAVGVIRVQGEQRATPAIIELRRNADQRFSDCGVREVYRGFWWVAPILKETAQHLSAVRCFALREV